MGFYKMQLRSIPTVIFAHTYKTDNYKMKFSSPVNQLEISFIEQGDIERIYSDGKLISFPAGSFAAILPGEAFVQESKSTFHQHSTFAIHCDCTITPATDEELFEYCSSFYNKEIQKMDMLGETDLFELIISEQVLPDPKNIECFEMIKKIINRHNISGGKLNKIACSGLALSFLYEYSSLCIGSAMPYDKQKSSTPSSILYTQKTMNYVAEHIDEKIYINQIAETISISSGYLSTVFKQNTGRSIVEYINFIKLNKVRELILTQNISLKQAGSIVGIEDEHYLYRLFKKQFGMSAIECKNRNGRPQIISDNVN